MLPVRTAALVALFACALAMSAAPADQNTTTQDGTPDVDRSIKAGDDFYRYANGGWLRTATSLAGQTSYDTRAILVARTSQRVRDLIQQAAAFAGRSKPTFIRRGNIAAILSAMSEHGIKLSTLRPATSCI